MNKKRNSILLFGVSFLILLGLQVFYIYNSYRLQEKDLNREALEISRNVIAEMEKSTESNEEHFVQNFWMLNNMDKIDYREVDSIRKTFISVEKLNLVLEKLLKKHSKNTAFKIAIKNEIYSVVDNSNNKELLTDPIIFYQTNLKMKNGLAIHEGKWNSNLTHSDTEKNLDERYSYKVKSRASFELMNLQTLIFQKIVPLCLVSLLILVLILYIFRKNTKNIEIQNKKITQLHTTIDSITHELNTPIATLKFLMASQEKNAANEVIDRQIQRLQQIVSSVHSTGFENDLVTEQGIQLLTQKLQTDYPTLQITATVQFEKSPLLTIQNLATILFNLVDNSFKYKAKSVSLTLDFTDKIRLTVSDDGIGIPQEEHHKIFEKYYRISRKENHEINGLGVGLHLVKSIVDNHNGKIEVVANSVGVAFKIQLPNEK